MTIARREFLLGSLALGMGGCAGTVWPKKTGPKVLASFAPLLSFAQNLLGDLGTALPLLTTAGPHGAGNASVEQLKLAKHADLLLFNGFGIDDAFAKKLCSAVGKSVKDKNVVFVGEYIPNADRREGVCRHTQAEGEHHDHGIDPHVWLSTKLARTMVQGIRVELAKIDPENATGYKARGDAYDAALAALDAEGIAQLQPKKERSILAFHDSLQYFAANFNLTIADAIEVDPGVEPGKERLTEIITACKKNNVRVIAVEPQFSRNTSAEQIRRALTNAGIDAKFVTVDPLETAADAELTPDFYVRKQRENLRNLAEVLQ